ncbi:MAG: ZIP family metal transporter [Elusimicrobiota bacterium]
MMLPVFLCLATFLSTLIGGLFAVRLRDRLNLILGFMAGFLLGIVGFDIFPEIIRQINVGGFNPAQIMAALVGAFLLFHVIEKMIVIHHAHEGEYAGHHHPQVGVFSALALIGHSLMDGVGIGLGFQVNRAVGLIVALAVISHDFTDGMNTVTLMLSNHNSVKKAVAYLVFDAAAPVLGLILASAFSFPPRFLALYLGAFAGFLLYIGAADILPEAHSERSSGLTIAMTVAGAVAAFLLSCAL